MAPHNRKIDYINRVMYLKEYAKEIRLTNVFKLIKKLNKFEELPDYLKEIANVVSKLVPFKSL